MSGFDISAQEQLAAKEDEGTPVHLYGLDGKPAFYGEEGNRKPVTITVAGEHSERYRAVLKVQRRRKLKARSLTPEQLQEDALERIAACVIRWEGIQDRGVDVPCDAFNARELIRRLPHVQEQLEEAMGETSRFF